MLKFACPHCGVGLKAPPEKAGTALTCPKCRQKIRVPAESNADEFALLDDSVPSEPVISKRLTRPRAGRRIPPWCWALIGVVGVGAVGAIVVVAVLLTKSAATDDKDLLQGSWLLVDLAGDLTAGEMRNYEAVQKMRFQFSGGNVLVFDGRTSAQKEWRFRLDPKQRPKTIDLIGNEDTLFALYELDGDVLKICQYMSGESVAKRRRPLEIKAANKAWVMTFKRERQ